MANTAEEHEKLSNTDLAFERTMLAEERTLMAWIRTAMSLISFGFTIYKFFSELSKDPEGHHPILTPRIVGMIMISFGLLGLFMAQIQHSIAVRKLRRDYPKAQRSIASVMSILVFVFGLTLFLAAVFRE